MNVNCSISNRVFLTVWTMAICSNMVASFDFEPKNAIKSFKQHNLQGWPAAYSSDIATGLTSSKCVIHIAGCRTLMTQTYMIRRLA